MVRAMALSALVIVAACATARAHEEGEHGGGGHHRDFAAGEPGDPAGPARVVKVTMREEDGDKRMLFAPDHVEVRRGEQVRFVLENGGIYAHEFLLDTPERNQRHAAAMRRNPDMQHDDPNGTRVPLGATRELVWRFSKPGTFEFACLISGHYEAGMHGTVTVK